MNRKTIKGVLKKKFNDWIKTIDDPALQDEVSKNTIITGGAIASMLMNERPKDFDVYFTNKATTKRVAEYYVKKWNDTHGPQKNKIGHINQAFVLDGALDLYDQLAEKGYERHEVDLWKSHMIRNLEPDRIKIIIRSDGVASEDPDALTEPFEDVYDVLDRADDIPEDVGIDDGEVPTPQFSVSIPLVQIPKYRPVFLSSNAITLSDQIQIVIRFHGDVEEIHSNYDFVHTTCSWESSTKSLDLRPEALEAILTKTLIYSGSKYPLCSVIRMRKFIKRGWHINAGQILKMLFQVSELDLKDIAVLEDQLVGVDSAYFMQLIEALESRMKNDSDFQISTEYVSTIIDKVFG